jgi:hypothetical protein
VVHPTERTRVQATVERLKLAQVGNGLLARSATDCGSRMQLTDNPKQFGAGWNLGFHRCAEVLHIGQLAHSRPPSHRVGYTRAGQSP